MGRNCGECTLAERGLCPSAVVNRKTQVKKIKKETVNKEGMKMEESVVVKEEEQLAEDAGVPS